MEAPALADQEKQLKVHFNGIDACTAPHPRQFVAQFDKLRHNRAIA
ncbi:hypothetical protein [Cupriavidus lacunae]|nr:hypothetical protein [Cupriavidus lacunae]